MSRESDAGPQKGDLLQVTIEDLTPRGAGLAHFEGGGARPYTVEVPRTIPGDRVTVSIRGVRKRTLACSLVEVREPAVERIEPRCQHFDPPGGMDERCGGCTLQAIAYHDQLVAKLGVVKRLLARAGVAAEQIRTPVRPESPWHYRNKMEFSFGRDRRGQPALGLHPPGYNYQVFDLRECFLISPEIGPLVHQLANWLRAAEIEPFVSFHRGGFARTLTVREGKRTGDRMVEFTTTDDPTTSLRGATVEAAVVAQDFLSALLAASEDLATPITSVYWTRHRAVRGEPTRTFETHLHGGRTLREELHLPGQPALAFNIHPRAFFQPNTRGAELLYAEVGRAAQAAAGGVSMGRVLDLYCGTGTIGLTLARRAQHVIGIELQPDAVANAHSNATLNGIENVEFHAGDVARVLRDLGDDASCEGERDLIVLDPPRSGLMPAALHLLVGLEARHMVYVSCNPTALARDLIGLTEAGWRLQYVQPVDLFPQTAHIESVALLTRSQPITGQRAQRNPST